RLASSVEISGTHPMRQFMLPDLGEGLEEAEIVTWHVNEGDHVVTDQPLVSVETDKAVVEVPSPWTGRIARVFANKGDLVKVGAPLVEFAEGAEQDTGTVVGQLDTGEKQAAVVERPAESAPARMLQVLPAVRALAHKLDVDLNAVQATGPGGTITRADVERAAKSLAEAGPAEALRGMRRAMAQRMAAAHAEVVPATVTDDADIDEWRTGEDPSVRFASLVVVPPQVAIVGAGRISEMAVAHKGQPSVRRVLPLSLTFDHRVVTGGEAARFIVTLKSDLERTS